MGFVRLIEMCTLTMLFCTGAAVAETMSHGSQNSSEHGAMTRESHGTAHQAAAPSGLDTIAYSLFMHRSSGTAVIVLGVLVLTDRLTKQRHGAVQMAIGVVWLMFGAHVFIRSDPEGWPIGPAGFMESLSMRTAGEWVQHKLLAMIPVALGLWTLLSRR